MEQAYLATATTLTAQMRVDALVREYQVKLARYVRRMVGDSEVALDVTQDVFLSAYRTLARDPDRPLTAGWLYKTATNAAISFLRRKKLMQFVALDREAASDSWRIDERSAASIDLQTAISRLPSEQAAALLLTAYAGYSSHEAAALLGTTPEAVRQRVCRAMRVMRSVVVESA